MSFFRLKRAALVGKSQTTVTKKVKQVKPVKATKPQKPKLEITEEDYEAIDEVTQGILSSPLPGKQRISYKTAKSIATKDGNRMPVTISPASENLAARRACNTAACWTPALEAELDALSKPSEAALIARAGEWDKWSDDEFYSAAAGCEDGWEEDFDDE